MGGSMSKHLFEVTSNYCVWLYVGHNLDEVKSEHASLFPDGKVYEVTQIPDDADVEREIEGDVVSAATLASESDVGILSSYFLFNE